jgi:2-oxo-4-hydroxy-4-carboxy-5-ureidoimidazoline decarboxylase
VKAGRGCVTRFNAVADAELRPQLLTCLAVPRWVEAVLAGRPYADLAALTARAGALAADVDDSELAAALARHPRIGAPPSGAGTEARWSRAEQSGVDPADPDVAVAVRDGNAVYEARFGHVFLVRAAGRTSAELLANLRDRLGNDPAVERGVVRDQLGQIATRRLADLVGRLQQEAAAGSGGEPA